LEEGGELFGDHNGRDGEFYRHSRLQLLHLYGNAI
jgi:hypothetical protein